MIQSIIDDFVKFLDAIYYEGFAEQFCKDYPQEYTDELNKYLDTITWKPDDEQ